MSTTKKILFVDDNFETIDFFRSMLDLMDNRFIVTSAPSAEEAWLEYGQKEFDLLITDLRLPGMSGIELIKRVHQKRPGFPAILISGYERDQVKAELEEVEITAYLEKPYEATELLKLMQVTMFGEAADRKKKGENGGTETAPAEPAEIKVDLSGDAKDALSSLSFYTGGDQVLLGLLNGQIIHQLVPSTRFNLAEVGPWMGHIIDAGNRIGQQIGSGPPQSIYHLEVDNHIIFVTGVGQRYFVALFLDNRSERGRLGVLWVAMQRISKDLSALLPDVDQPIGVGPVAAAPVPQPTPAPAATPSRPIVQRRAPAPAKVEPAPPPPPPAEPEFVPLTEPIIPDDALTGLLEDESLWATEAAPELSVDSDDLTKVDSPNGKGLSYEDAVKQGILEPPPPVVQPERKINTGLLMNLIESAAEPEEPPTPEESSDLYWIEAAQTEKPKQNDSNRGFLSLEDAIEQGLLGKDFGKETNE